MSRSPLPQPTPLTQGYWDAARDGRLVIQRCDECEVLRHYPRLRCPECGGDRWSWHPVSGLGTVHTFTVTHQAFNPTWADRVPYAVATIELDEGVRVVSDLPPGDETRIAIGARAEVFFEQVSDELTIPRFRLV